MEFVRNERELAFHRAAEKLQRYWRGFVVRAHPERFLIEHARAFGHNNNNKKNPADFRPVVLRKERVQPAYGPFMAAPKVIAEEPTRATKTHAKEKQLVGTTGGVSKSAKLKEAVVEMPPPVVHPHPQRRPTSPNNVEQLDAAQGVSPKRALELKGPDDHISSALSNKLSAQSDGVLPKETGARYDSTHGTSVTGNSDSTSARTSPDVSGNTSGHQIKLKKNLHEGAAAASQPKKSAATYAMALDDDAIGAVDFVLREDEEKLPNKAVKVSSNPSAQLDPLSRGKTRF
jgi:hypothetical protein